MSSSPAAVGVVFEKNAEPTASPTITASTNPTMTFGSNRPALAGSTRPMHVQTVLHLPAAYRRNSVTPKGITTIASSPPMQWSATACRSMHHSHDHAVAFCFRANGSPHAWVYARQYETNPLAVAQDPDSSRMSSGFDFERAG